MRSKTDSERTGLCPKTLKGLTEVLRTFTGLEAAYLHGSAARNSMRSDSDVDIALLFAPKIKPDPLALLELAGALESAAGYPVHLGVLDLGCPVFAKEVFTHAVPLLEVDGGYGNEFWMYALSYYAELNEQRLPVLDAYGVGDHE